MYKVKIIRNIQGWSYLSLSIKHGGQIVEFCYNSTCAGGLAERFKAPSWKGGEVQASVSSNLMSSAIFKENPLFSGLFCFFVITITYRLLKL